GPALRGQIPVDGSERGITYWNDPLLVPLAQHTDGPVATIEVGTIEPAAFGHPDSGRIQELDHRVIAHCARRRIDGTVQELLRFVFRHERWEPARLSWASDLTGRVAVDHTVPRQIA